MSEQIQYNDEKEKKSLPHSFTKKVATSAIFMAVGLVLSYLNPFAYFEIFGTRINPFAHFINAITGVLIGLIFSCITALGIATLRFSLSIGTIHAFHGGITGAFVVGIVSHILRKKYPKYVEFAAFTEPLGTVFLGGTIAHLIVPIGSYFAIESLFTYWILFALSCIPGCIMGFIILMILKKAKITWEDFY
ncbi:MAG: energy coupling factor transporter S component ThiW [Candidatus Odinarchaeota archaeon]